MSKKILSVLFVVAMIFTAVLATQVLAQEFRFELQSRENFAGSNDLVNNTNSLNGREVCEPGFSVTFTEKDGKVVFVHTYAADANIPAGSLPKINSNKAKSIQELRLYFPAGTALSNYADVTGAVIGTDPTDKKKTKVFDSILLAPNGSLSNSFAFLPPPAKDMSWSVFESALNDLIASNAEFFILGHYSFGYGPGGAKSIQVGRLNLVLGGEVVLVHGAFGSFDKVITGPYVNPFVNSTFTFGIYCDEFPNYCFGKFTTDGDGVVDFHIHDQFADKVEGKVTGASLGDCPIDDTLEGYHFVIRELLPNDSLWIDESDPIGFFVTVCDCGLCDEGVGDCVFDDFDDEVPFFENGAAKSSNFWMAVHFAKGSGGNGDDETTTLTLGGTNGGSTGQGWGFTYFNASGLSLTNPIYCNIVKGGTVVKNCKAIVSLEVNAKSQLEIVIRFEDFNVSGAVHVGVSATETGVKNLGAPGSYPFQYTAANNTVTIPFSVFQNFMN